jgi:tetratricopeptide (TPR) repeat protein
MAGSQHTTPERNAQQEPGKTFSGNDVTEAVGRLKAEVRSNPDNIEAALTLAEYYNSLRQDEDILATLDVIERHLPTMGDKHRRRYWRLMAYASVRHRRFYEAERAIEAGLREFPEAIDFHYAMAFAKASLRENQDAIAAAQKYLKLYDRAVSDPPRTHFSVTPGHRSHLLNFMGTAYRESGKAGEAEQAFAESINADPANHLPYLNLANLHVQKGNWEKADAVIARGLEHCQQVQELRLLQRTFQKHATVSACMIVKDEEKMLEGCLRSIRDWVTEIIVVDTGSTDRTVEIAESFGAKIFHQPWEGDFSKHRNYSIEQATGDWIFIIDADERVFEEDVPQIFQLVNQDEHRFISVNVINVYGRNEEFTTFLPSERFFRRELNLRYKGIVHNQLDVPPGVRALRTGVRIKHYGYGLEPEKMKRKLARSRALLERQIEENPDNAFAHFNLAQLLRVGDEGFPIENADLVIEHAGRGIQLTRPDKSRERHIHLMCLNQLGWAYFYIQDYDKALEYAERALEHKPDYLDPLLLLGHIAFQRKNYDEAERNYERYLATQAAYDPSQEMSNIILSHVDSRTTVYYALAMICQIKSRSAAAIENYERTLQLNPGFLEANSHLGRIYFNEGALDRAEQFFRWQFERAEPSHEAALGLAALCRSRGNSKETEKYYRLAIELQPDDDSTRIKLARFLAEADRAEEAAGLLETVTTQHHNDPAVIKELAGMYLSLGRLNEALGHYQVLLDQGRADSEIFNDVGNCYFKRGDFEEAERYYRQAVQSSPPLAISNRNLGLTEVRLNKPHEAIKALERYLAENPNEPDFIHITADLHLQLGEWEPALSLYEQYLARNPSDVLALFNLSECYLHMGHTDSAVLGYRRVLQMDPGFGPAQERLATLTQPAGQA